MLIPTNTLGSITEWQSGREWGAADLVAQGCRTAEHLKSIGVRRGHNVILWHGGTGQFFGDLIGIWKLGACAVCLNPSTTREEIERIIKFVDAAAVMDSGAQRLDLELGTAILDSSLFKDSGVNALGHSQLDDNAVILFTSGTTGTPKGVVHSFRSLLARISLNQVHLPHNVLRRTLSVLPTHFGHGLIGNCLTPLLGGHPLVLAPATNLDVTANLGDIIDTYNITFMSSVPTFWKKTLRSATPPKKGSLRQVHVGSAPLSSDLWHDIAKWSGTRNILNMYGITETANWIAGASLTEAGAEDGLVGSMWGGKAAVLTNAGKIDTHGIGELLVQSPSLMKGYFELPDETNNVLRNGWFHTGDIGNIDPNGIIRLTGRKKYEINRGGIKVHPEDIDLLLERHETIEEACCFALPDELEGEVVGVAVVTNTNSDVTIKDLRRWCAERLAREKIPSRWFIVEDIPKTDRGKTNRDTVAKYCLKLRA